MTTIAANLREIAGDTKCSWEGVGTDVYSSIKLFVGNNALYGVTGEETDGSLAAIEWLQMGAPKVERPEPPKNAKWKLLELSPSGLAVYNTYLERDVILDRNIAVGSGRKVAMYCMRVLGMSPAEAVREACRVDDWSDLPVYTASLSGMTVQKWAPKK